MAGKNLTIWTGKAWSYDDLNAEYRSDPHFFYNEARALISQQSILAFKGTLYYRIGGKPTQPEDAEAKDLLVATFKKAHLGTCQNPAPENRRQHLINLIAETHEDWRIETNAYHKAVLNGKIKTAIFEDAPYTKNIQQEQPLSCTEKAQRAFSAEALFNSGLDYKEQSAVFAAYFLDQASATSFTEKMEITPDHLESGLQKLRKNPKLSEMRSDFFPSPFNQ